jgi:hypothetical protein
VLWLTSNRSLNAQGVHGHGGVSSFVHNSGDWSAATTVFDFVTFCFCAVKLRSTLRNCLLSKYELYAAYQYCCVAYTTAHCLYRNVEHSGEAAEVDR